LKSEHNLQEMSKPTTSSASIFYGLTGSLPQPTGHMLRDD